MTYLGQTIDSLKFGSLKEICVPSASVLHLTALMEQLHGTLDVTIFEATQLRDSPRATGIFVGMFKSLVGNATDQGNGDVAKRSIYAAIFLENTIVGKTQISKNDPVNPSWNESFHIYCAHKAANVIITIKDDNKSGETLGTAYIPVRELQGGKGKEVDKWVELCDNSGRPKGGGAKIHIKLQYIGITGDDNWSQGIRSREFSGVPYTFFSQREGCKVTLYQDSHVPDQFNPRIILDGGNYYEAQQRCWEDIFDAINNARHLIYISGWSLYTEITLIRDPRRQKPEGGVTLGELLKRKANQGVTVLMLVWEDISSQFPLITDQFPIMKEVFMDTHNKETENYFKNTRVHCILCPRMVDTEMGLIGPALNDAIFSHHQKTLVVDSEAKPYDHEQSQVDKRRIVSFVGGLDLTQGRYDTQSHSLFRTLDSTSAPHRDDFYQPSFSNSSIKKGGPRQPWHDIHCRLEGPIAWDVLSNFEQRWKKQGGGEQLLLDQTKIIITDPETRNVTFPDDPETWNVQLFRSIDGGAAYRFPDKAEGAAKDYMIERSIQDAYIHAIRRAKDFIYIENQFFIGGSFGWKSKGIRLEDIGAVNLIPKELSLKIVSKIEAGQRFTVYVVLPMRPEGKPDSLPENAMICWQRKTMKMMYKDVAQALREKKVDARPRDYLSFFCLANREVKNIGEYTPTEKLDPTSDRDYIKAQQARRFMIYVHSKMMIVDDEYIIVGSANINQRSMDGGRDTEIAMGAFQPSHLATKQPARGQIHGFRMALWFEHLNMLDDSFLYPQKVECICKVNEIADKNWEMYSSNKPPERDLPSHLVSYPITVTNDGRVTHLPGMQFLPDTKVRIFGSKSEAWKRYLPKWFSSGTDQLAALVTT